MPTLVEPTIAIVGRANNCYAQTVPRSPVHATAAAPARVRDRPSWLVSRAYARVNGLLNAAFEADGAGLRSYHYRLLAALDESGPASQASLGRGTGIDRSDVALAMADLESRGLIKRSVDPSDRRRNVVAITERGRTQLAALDAVIDDVQRRLLAPLTATEGRQFVQLLRRVAEGE
jgi:MarR family transcriptional regulator, lower aerobic nicotinate degradation pathway regulator